MTIDPSLETPLQIVLDYHDRTKHGFERYAAGPGFLDWASQPGPFRRFEGAPFHPFPLPGSDPDFLYPDLFTSGDRNPAPLNPSSLSKFLRYALSLTAWKKVGETSWSLRANPSSGNLHPTEAYLLLPPLEGRGPGLYHYAPQEHGLETRALLGEKEWENIPPGVFWVGLSSVYRRESWKYGERAFRYCQHDIGHAMGSLRFAAAALGWKLRLIDNMPEDKLASLLGLNRSEDFKDADPEYAQLLLQVSIQGANSPEPPLVSPPAIPTADHWKGRAFPKAHLDARPWPIIDQVALNTRSGGEPLHENLSGLPSSAPVFPPQRNPPGAEKVILGRRSALGFDGASSMPREDFYRMLARLIPAREGIAPWDVFPWRPHLHLGLFIHRVQDLASGLYLLARDPEMVPSLQAALDPSFHWAAPAANPPGLPLFLLQAGDFRGTAAGLACHQSIAGDGVFSVAMLADFRDTLALHGPSFYRCLYWEAGLVGQTLYLEAEAQGLRGTGIGCYFDDAVHRVFGIRDHEFQSLYHFTVGKPVEDPRLVTLEPYGTLAERNER